MSEEPPARRMHAARLVAVAATLLFYSPAAAQENRPTRLGLFVGVSVPRSEDVNSGGLHIVGTLGRVQRPGVSARFDLGYGSFKRQSDFYLCPLPPDPCGTLPGNILRLITVNANVVYSDPSATLGSYWTAGLGAYAVTESPSDGAYLRPGWNVGMGSRIGPNAFIEVRYHAIVSPRDLRGYLPIALGVRF